MTKREKQLARLMSKQNLKWNELVKILEQLGFKQVSNKGGSSHYKFINEAKGLVISACRPHPSNEVKPYLLRQIKQALKDWGFK